MRNRSLILGSAVLLISGGIASAQIAVPLSGFVEGIDRSQSSLFPAQLEDYVAEDNLVRAVDAFVAGLDLGKLGFGRVASLETGRPCYHPATLLKIYIYGYLNRVPSSRRLERECRRNIELIWLTGQLARWEERRVGK